MIEQDIQALRDEIAALRAEVMQLRAELAALRQPVQYTMLQYPPYPFVWDAGGGIYQ